MIIIFSQHFIEMKKYQTVHPTNILIAPWEPEGGVNSNNPPIPVEPAQQADPISNELIAPWEGEGNYNSRFTGILGGLIKWAGKQTKSRSKILVFC